MRRDVTVAEGTTAAAHMIDGSAAPPPHGVVGETGTVDVTPLYLSRNTC
jgi:hypothetical protein